MLNYLAQVMYGFRGNITDLDTGEPIEAKIKIEGHDFDNSYVVSNLDGDYYRPIKAGTYTLNFSAESYDSKSVSNQFVDDFDSKVVDIILQKTDTGIDSNILSKLKIINPIRNHKLQIISPIDIKTVKIYNILGQLVLSKETNTKELFIEIDNFQAGVYIVKLELINGAFVQKRIVSP